MNKNHIAPLLLLFVFSFTASCKAQYVPIPDNNFVAFLYGNGFGSCMIGNTLDTGCLTVVNTKSLTCIDKSIADFTGIQYFDKLNYFNCAVNLAVTLPQLPATLDTLVCTYNVLTSLPALPSGLLRLECDGNKLASLPALPAALNYLDCSGNNITALPLLPSTLIKLRCYDNLLTGLPALPPLMDYLHCSSNPLFSLPAIPSTVKYLYCNYDSLSALPVLPLTLIELGCDGNKLTSLMPLPDSLHTLSCSHNQLSTLPALVPPLENLYCSDNPLFTLPALPSSLIHLTCCQNFLAGLPALPPALRTLNCCENQITALPAMPLSLMYLYCDNNLLTSIPPLGYVNIIDASYNQLTSFPSFSGISPNASNYNFSNNNITFLPDLSGVPYVDCSDNQISQVYPFGYFSYLDCSNNLISSFSAFNLQFIKELYCHHNQLTTLPPINGLNASVDIIDAAFNQITTIPAIKGTWMNIDLSSNQLTYIQELDEKLFRLDVSNNPGLTCIPVMDSVTHFLYLNTAVNCLPKAMHIQSATPSVSGMGLCQPASGCEYSWNMYGNIFNDLDSDSIIDPGEGPLKNIPVTLDSAGVVIQTFLTNEEGYFSFETGHGTYTVTIDTPGLPYNIVWPLSGNFVSVLTPIDSLDPDMNFGLKCKPGYLDLASISAAVSAPLRPAAFRTIFLQAGDAAKVYGVSCASGISGYVQAVLDGPVGFVSAAAGSLTPAWVNGDTIRWNISDFAIPDPQNAFNIIVQVDTFPGMADTLCINLEVSLAPGEANTLNNNLSICFPVVNSFDPNIKLVYPAGIAPLDEDLTYTIFFQNTGTAPAENIYILDSLDADLDESTFRFLTSSHPCITQLLPGRVLRFSLPDINLPDSTSDEPGSHGFVQFSIKRVATADPNVIIQNSAAIYFDFNPPVLTDPASTVFNFDCNLLNSIVLSDSVICPGEVIQAFNDVVFPFPLQFLWKLDTTVLDSTSSAISLAGVPSGHHMLYLTVTYEGCTITKGRIILVYNAPVSTITATSDSLFVASGNTYQWYFNGIILPGANQHSIPYLQTGYYMVQVNTVYGCVIFSEPAYLCMTIDSLITSNLVICPYDTITATTGAVSAEPVSCQWLVDAVPVDTSQVLVLTGLSPGTHFLTLQAATGLSAATVNRTITVHPYVPQPVITAANDTLFSSSAISYQWYADSLPITGATQSFLIAGQDGIYTVMITDSNGCTAVSDPYAIIGTGITDPSGTSFQILPNPVSDDAVLIMKGWNAATVTVSNLLGETVYSTDVNGHRQVLGLQHLTAGIYIATIRNGWTSKQCKLVKQ